jgi:uncharacterized protein (TIGR02271 family)
MALYEDFETAQDVVEDLIEAGFPRDHISLIANNTEGHYTIDADGDDVSADEGAGFGAVVGGLLGLAVALIPGIGPVVAAGPLAAIVSTAIGAAAGAVTGGLVAGLVDFGVPEDEAEYYAEAVRRGSTLVSVVTEEENLARAQEIMNRHNPIDLEERASMWQANGWQGYQADAQPYTADQINQEREQYRTLATGEQTKFDVVEEELHVGKREVEKGGVRVHSYVTETPVREQVNLRQEHVRVDRHPVDRPASEADINAFHEGVIEVAEHAEEAVVSKQARVVEEVVVGKEVNERTETVEDTVRRTDVEVEQMNTGTRFQPFETYDQRFRTHYQTNFANSGYGYDQFMPAYRYGYGLATNDQYRGYDWTRLEPEARRTWEADHPNTWDRFKDAIRDAWYAVTGR